MKLCIIGNSHAACLKKAWDLGAAAGSGRSVQFFVSSGGSMQETAVRGGGIVGVSETVSRSFALTSGGSEAMVPGDHDAILVHGLTNELSKLVMIRQRVEALDGHSRGFLANAVVYNKLSGNHVLGLLESLRPAVPVLVSGRPNPAGETDDASPGLADAWAAEQDALSGLFASLGVVHVQQPLETLETMDATRHRFSIGSVGIGSDPTREGYRSKRTPDGQHMNADYGALVLERVFTLAEAAAGPVAAPKRGSAKAAPKRAPVKKAS